MLPRALYWDARALHGGEARAFAQDHPERIAAQQALDLGVALRGVGQRRTAQAPAGPVAFQQRAGQGRVSYCS